MLRRVILSMTGLLPVTCCLFRCRIPLKLDDAALMHSRSTLFSIWQVWTFRLDAKKCPEQGLFWYYHKMVYPHSCVSGWYFFRGSTFITSLVRSHSSSLGGRREHVHRVLDLVACSKFNWWLLWLYYSYTHTHHIESSSLLLAHAPSGVADATAAWISSTSIECMPIVFFSIILHFIFIFGRTAASPSRCSCARSWWSTRSSSRTSDASSMKHQSSSPLLVQPSLGSTQAPPFSHQHSLYTAADLPLHPRTLAE